MGHEALDVRIGTTPGISRWLKGHPRARITGTFDEPGLRFAQGRWERSVVVGDAAAVGGLVELIDNNPLVCADVVSVPDPASTLALIAFGPLIRTGLLAEPPVFQTNAPGNAETVEAFLAAFGWPHGVAASFENLKMGSVWAAQCGAIIDTPESLDEIDEIFDEAYGRSFYVQNVDDGNWTPDLVRQTPRAVYRIRISPEAPRSLLTIQVMGDQEGKLGGAQIVHAMNVMAGLEESLGLDAAPGQPGPKPDPT
ncbi:MAG: hypothetical protein SNJ74_04845 [Fimbriimonadaceae bacterium]